MIYTFIDKNLFQKNNIKTQLYFYLKFIKKRKKKIYKWVNFNNPNENTSPLF